MMVFPVVVPMHAFSDEDGRSGEPLSEREELNRWTARAVAFVILVLLIHCFLVPNPAIAWMQNMLTWSENVNTLTIRGADGAEAYTLSGSCYVVGDGWVNIHGGPRPGPAAVSCDDGDSKFYYRAMEGASVSVEKSGGSWGWETPKATIRKAGSPVAVRLSESGGRGGV